MTPCHICQAEAVTRCFNCGELVCADHGKNDTCPNCNAGFAAGDPRATHISNEPMAKPESQHAWWRPQEAEEYQPPACYKCKGLSRATCRNCRDKYCQEHAGPNGLCQDCGRSANLGLYVIAAVAVLLLLSWLLTWWFG
jgi:hypothetical protein